MNDNWTQTSLGELENNGEANIQTGPFGTVLKASEYSEQGSPVISVGEIRYGYIHVSDQTPKVSDETKERLPQFVLRAGDIVFGRKGAIDRNSIVNENQTGWFLGSDGIRLRLSENLDSLFVSYQFRCPTIGKWLLQNSSGSVMPSLNQKTLNRLPLWLPSSHEQQNISTILSTLDKKIELNNLINAELEAMAKLIYDYWFVQFDFPDAKGKPYKSSGGKMVYNEALKREIPDGWEVKKLSEITSLIRRGISPKYVEENGISVVNQKCIRNQTVSFEPSRRHGGKMKVNDERFLLLKDVLVNSTGVGTLGRVAFIKRMEEKNTTVDSHVTIVRADPQQVNETLLAWQMLRLQPIIEKSAQGSTGQVELNKSYLEDLDIIVPTNDVQEMFKSFIVPIETKMSNSEVESQILVKLRNWLLPMLMNGQVIVKDLADSK